MVTSSSSRGRGGRKGLSFELNLIPFIDILSTCISFLLMTVVFIGLGTVNVKQAIGSEPALGQEKDPPMMWLEISNGGDVAIKLKNVAGQSTRVYSKISAVNSRLNLKKTETIVASLQTKYPEIKTALIMPASKSKYSDLIGLMDQLRQKNVPHVGIAPL